MDEAKLVGLMVRAVKGGDVHDARARSYSGRGMYGRDCLGVVTSNPRRTLREMTAALSGLADPAEDDPAAALAEYAVCSDSMGLGVVVYWPDLPPPPATEDEDEGVA